MFGDERVDDWIVQARQGDRRALGHLLDHFRPYLLLLARLKISPQLQAKADHSDVVQETVTAAFEDFKQFRGNSEPQLAAWLRQILANKGINLQRRFLTQGRNVRQERRLGEELDQSSCALAAVLAASNSTPSERLMRRERAVQLARLLSRLPNDYREVLILRELEGLKLAEISQKMGRSLDSVQKLWTRAVMKLREMIEVDDEHVAK